MSTQEHGRNPTQERMDEEGTEDRPVDVEWEEEEGGTGADDGGPGSQNM